jgi:hypothetical protein
MGDNIGDARTAALKKPYQRTDADNALIARNTGDQQVRNNNVQGQKDQKDFGKKDKK